MLFRKTELVFYVSARFGGGGPDWNNALCLANLSLDNGREISDYLVVPPDLPPRRKYIYQSFRLPDVFPGIDNIDVRHR